LAGKIYFHGQKKAENDTNQINKEGSKNQTEEFSKYFLML
jgi:hypothetical protein